MTMMIMTIIEDLPAAEAVETIAAEAEHHPAGITEVLLEGEETAGQAEELPVGTMTMIPLETVIRIYPMTAIRQLRMVTIRQVQMKDSVYLPDVQSLLDNNLEK